MGDGGSPETFATIAQLRDITPPAIQTATEDVTSHDSGGWREFVGTINEAGEMEFEIGYDSADPTHNATTGLVKAAMDRLPRNYKVVFPSNGTWSLGAIVTEFSPTGAVAGVQTAKVKMRPTGPMSIA